MLKISYKYFKNKFQMNYVLILFIFLNMICFKLKNGLKKNINIYKYFNNKIEMFKKSKFIYFHYIKKYGKN